MLSRETVISLRLVDYWTVKGRFFPFKNKSNYSVSKDIFILLLGSFETFHLYKMCLSGDLSSIPKGTNWLSRVIWSNWLGTVSPLPRAPSGGTRSLWRSWSSRRKEPFRCFIINGGKIPVMSAPDRYTLYRTSVLRIETNFSNLKSFKL